MTLPNPQGAAQVLALHASPQARGWSRAVNAYRDAEAEQLWATAIENVNATHGPRERAPRRRGGGRGLARSANRERAPPGDDDPHQDDDDPHHVAHDLESGDAGLSVVAGRAVGP